MKNSSPLITPRLDWLVFLAAVGFSLTLLFLGHGVAVSAVKRELGGVVAVLGKPLALAKRSLGLWAENTALREQAMSLSLENATMRDAVLENERLRAMLAFRQRFPYPLTTAEVIGFPGSQVGGRILLDVGRGSGVRVNCAVVTPEGLVGKVVEVSSLSSLVQTLEGNAYGVSVMIERSRAGGVLRWLGPERWSIVGLATGEDVRVGDLVVTTGHGLVFPKGIRVGVVSEVMAQTEPGAGWCRVRPFVRFSSLEEVFVIAPAPSAISDEDLPGKEAP